MIGGGAQVTNFSNTNVGVNALLTAAYPVNDGTFTTYGAASKDHQQLYNHRLWVYAIGLRIWGCTSNCKVPGLFTTTEIINGLNMSTVTSSPATSYPTAVVTVPAGYTALSGGAFIHWTGQGNLLVENGFPGIGVLASTGKDQVVVSPATITSYCLSYKSLQDCGSLSIQNVTNSALITQHAQSISQAADPGYLISGVAGLSFFDPGGFGRLLFAMYPNNSTSATVSSKDQGSTDIGGSLDITITEIKPNF
jgi:hypothetical protein